MLKNILNFKITKHTENKIKRIDPTMSFFIKMIIKVSEFYDTIILRYKKALPTELRVSKCFI